MAKKNVDNDFHTATDEELKEVREAFADAPKPAPAKTVKKAKTGKVDGCSDLNVREKPDANATALCQIRAGVVVEILGEEGDRYKVRIAQSFDGYCMKKYIK